MYPYVEWDLSAPCTVRLSVMVAMGTINDTGERLLKKGGVPSESQMQVRLI